MYLKHFGLAEFPFGLTPDTSFFFASNVYQEALNTLLVAVAGGEGFIKLTGEVGTGKTLLCRKFMAALDKRFYTAYLPNPLLEPRTLLLALAEELKIDVPPDVDQHYLLRSINHRLLDITRGGQRVVLCIDEAQAIPIETLEALRLLTNLETEKRKLLQIVLFGQPELDVRLADPTIRQLRQRISFHYEMRSLAREDIAYYLAHRLHVAGYAGGPLFRKPALTALHAASGGVPRLVNMLGHKCLMAVYGEGGHQVKLRHVLAAAEDTVAARRPGWWVRMGLAR